jgi:hypothetical protein
MLNGGCCPELRELKLSGNVFELEGAVNLFHPRLRRRMVIS